MLYWVGKTISYIVLKVFCRFKIQGREHIPRQGGFILASNHVSYLDPLAVGAACPRKLSYMAKEELFKNRFFAWVLPRLGSIPLKRNVADFSAIREAMRRLEKGSALVIFPEGGRQFENKPSVAEAGIGFFAAKLDVPVIPAFVSGTDKALPRRAKFIRPHRVLVSFGAQVPIERRLPYEDIAKTIMDSIRRLAC